MELKRRSSKLFALSIVIAANWAVCSAWSATPAPSIDIPAGEAQKTLLQFYLQSKVQVLYLTEAVTGIKTRAVKGEFEPARALQMMLEGTGLTFEFESETTAVVRVADLAAPPSVDKPTDPASASSSPAQASAIPPPGPANSVGELVVTGSLIRGVLDVMSPLTVVTRKEMKRTAYATVQDALYGLPFSAGAAQGEDFAGTGNFNRGSAINLRGLGAGATLVLVNGRRQAQAGLQADFVDVSNIPWSIVDRVEVLANGTSALYGSDAIAGVVNVILLKELKGAESQLRFGTAADGATETVAAQLLGHTWERGRWLLAYQYAQRTSLAAANRYYTADSDKRNLGGRNHSSLRSNPGNILDPRSFGAVYAIPSGQNGMNLTPGDLIPGATNWQNTLAQIHLLPYKEMHSAYLSASQQATDNLELFAEARISERANESRGSSDRQLLLVPSSNPYFVDPFGGSPYVVVAYDFLDDLGPHSDSGETQNISATAGLTATLADSWQTTFALSRARENLRYVGRNTTDVFALSAALADPDPLTAFNPFGDGSHTNPATLDTIRYVQSNRASSQIDTLSLVADGDLLQMPQGIAKLALGMEHREEGLKRLLRLRSAGANPLQYLERSVDAVFAELSVPLIGQAADPRLVPRLDLSLAGRYERYRDFGGTFNPKIGLRWVPTDTLKMRASWGTSFKAPKLVDLYDTSQNLAGPVVFPDPRSPTGQSSVLLHLGSNPDLQEETATTWSIGFDLTPKQIPGLVLSFTGFDIEYNDQVIQPGGMSLFSILLQENQWSSAITRNPSQEQIEAFCAHPDVFVPVQQCTAAAPAALIDARLRNLATINTQGLDISLNYSIDTRRGHFNSFLEGTRVFKFDRAFTKTSPAADLLDSLHNSLGLRLRGGVQWDQYGPQEPGLGIGLLANHMGAYRNPDSPIRPEIDAWTTVDLSLRYRTGVSGRWWDDLEVNLNAINVFDDAPPFVDDEWGYDRVNVEPLGRVWNVYFEKRW